MLADAQTRGESGEKRQRPRRSLSGAAVKRCGVAFPRPRMNGSDGVTRTRDPVINSHLLYRLSYSGMCKAAFQQSLVPNRSASSAIREWVNCLTATCPEKPGFLTWRQSFSMRMRGFTTTKWDFFSKNRHISVVRIPEADETIGQLGSVDRFQYTKSCSDTLSSLPSAKATGIKRSKSAYYE